MLLGITAPKNIDQGQPNSLSTSNSQSITGAETKDTNLQEWLYVKDDDKEDFIKKHLEGKWIQLCSVIKDNGDNSITRINYSENAKKGERFFAETYQGEDVSISSSNPQTGTKTKSKFLLTGDSLKIITINSENYNTVDDNYKVDYISKNLLIRNDFEPSLNSTSLDVFSKSGFPYQDELAAVLLNIREDAHKGCNNVLLQIKQEDYVSAFVQSANIADQLLVLEKLDGSYSFRKDTLITHTIDKLKKVGTLLQTGYKEYYQNKLDSLSAAFKDQDIAFGTYQTEYAIQINGLKKIVLQMQELNMENSSLKSLYKTRSNAFNATDNSYSIYGDGDNISLRASAEEFLNENAYDPKSVAIQTAYKCRKQKQGWVYYVRYRAKNAFGALILTDVKLLMRYDSSSETYNVIKAF